MRHKQDKHSLRRSFLPPIFAILSIALILAIILFIWNSKSCSIVNSAECLQSNSKATNLTTGNYKSVIDNMATIIINQNPGTALNTLKTHMEKNIQVRAMCHEILHEIGRLSYRKYNNFAKAAEYIDQVCVSGYIHGVIEAYFLDNEIGDEITSLCSCKIERLAYRL